MQCAKEKRLTIAELPDLSDQRAVHQLELSLHGYTHQRGVKTLSKCLKQIERHMAFVKRYQRKVQLIVDVVNGGKTSEQYAGDHRRSVKTIARKFYSSLALPMVQWHCHMLGLEASDYEGDTEKMLDAMVQKHVERVETLEHQQNGQL